MENPKSAGDQGIRGKMAAQFIAGVFVLLPVVATVLLLYWLFTFIDGILQPVITLIVGRPITGVGFVVTILLIYLAGVIATNIPGKRLIGYAEGFLARVPVFRYVYTGIKQITDSFSAPQRTGFKRVVLVEFPRAGMMALGFVTKEAEAESGSRLLTVFIPTAPNPTAGFLQIVREGDVVRTDLSVDDAIRMVISAGIRLPAEVVDRLSRNMPPCEPPQPAGPAA